MASATATGRGRVGFRSIPQEQNLVDSITELDQRTRRLLEQLQDTSERQDDELRDLKANLHGLHEEVNSHVSELSDADGRIAVSGIRLEAVGLFLIASGVALQGVGSLLPDLTAVSLGSVLGDWT